MVYKRVAECSPSSCRVEVNSCLDPMWPLYTGSVFSRIDRRKPITIPPQETIADSWTTIEFSQELCKMDRETYCGQKSIVTL
jgi:hypothetical protein